MLRSKCHKAASHTKGQMEEDNDHPSQVLPSFHLSISIIERITILSERKGGKGNEKAFSESNGLVVSVGRLVKFLMRIQVL